MSGMSDLRFFSSESVTEGHPDKVCDLVSDSILDAHFAQDPRSRVACETFAKGNVVILGGEITSGAKVDLEGVVRRTVAKVGYDREELGFNAETLEFHSYITKQAQEISQGVTAETSLVGEQGAGDQGLMFGYACNETPELMPLPIALAHRLAREMAHDRHSGHQKWMRPDGKTQVTVGYDNGRPQVVKTVLIACSHDEDVQRAQILSYVHDDLAPRVLGEWFHDDLEIHVNPTGSFIHGGPATDCGLTGRKIIVDTYGGMARHGGGAFSGKDPSKVDRSAAYYCRYVARQLVKQKLAGRAEIQVAYAIGEAKPLSVYVETFGTGDRRQAQAWVERHADFRPARIIESLDLLRPIYAQTTNYGHFGRDGLPWEA